MSRPGVRLILGSVRLHKPMSPDKNENVETHESQAAFVCLGSEVRRRILSVARTQFPGRLREAPLTEMWITQAVSSLSRLANH